MLICCLGIDPGSTTGIALLTYLDGKLTGKLLLQADADCAADVLSVLLLEQGDSDYARKYCGIEKFVNGAGAGTKGMPAAVTRELVLTLTAVAEARGYSVKVRAAAHVKPWASDKRIIKARIKGCSSLNGKARDAYNAAGQALYAAHWDAKLPDPLLVKETP